MSSRPSERSDSSSKLTANSISVTLTKGSDSANNDSELASEKVVAANDQTSPNSAGALGGEKTTSGTDAKRMHNSKQGIGRITSENLLAIFRKLRDPFVLITVCHQWRTLALACPSLWTNIYMDCEDRKSFLIESSKVKSSLLRSRPLPIKVHLGKGFTMPGDSDLASLSEITSLMSAVTEEIHRCTHIRISDMLFLHPFFPLTGAIPNLRSLSLRFTTAGVHGMPPIMPIFDNASFPALEELDLGCFGERSAQTINSIFGRAQFTHRCTRLILDGFCVWSPQSFVQMLRLFPELSHLELGAPLNPIRSPSSWISINNPHSAATMPHLTTVRLDHPDQSAFLRTVIAPALTTVSVKNWGICRVYTRNFHHLYERFDSLQTFRAINMTSDFVELPAVISGTTGRSIRHFHFVHDAEGLSAALLQLKRHVEGAALNAAALTNDRSDFTLVLALIEGSLLRRMDRVDARGLRADERAFFRDLLAFLATGERRERAFGKDFRLRVDVRHEKHRLALAEMMEQYPDFMEVGTLGADVW